MICCNRGNELMIIVCIETCLSRFKKCNEAYEKTKKARGLS